MPRALVIRTAGTNCDAEMVRGFDLGGADTDLIHLDALIAESERLGEYGLIGFPGGFSYGDDIASGRVFAVRLRERLYPALRDAAQRGALMIGACNGFQVLVQVGLLPGPTPGADGSLDWPITPPRQRVALTDNIGARFIDNWVRIEPAADSPCVWTRPLLDPRWSEEALRLPIAHGEGRFVAESPALLAELEARGQVALRYAPPDNVNGSEGRIAGICDASGRIFGLMPHPERYLSWMNHPYWTRLDPGSLDGDTPAMMMFRAAVAAAGEGAPSAARAHERLAR